MSTQQLLNVQKKLKRKNEMVNNDYVSECVENFNMRLDQINIEVNGENGSFEYSIANLRNCDECIDALEKVVKQMKQERHDLTQDVYNKFKGTDYVKSIKF